MITMMSGDSLNHVVDQRYKTEFNKFIARAKRNHNICTDGVSKPGEVNLWQKGKESQSGQTRRTAVQLDNNVLKPRVFDKAEWCLSFLRRQFILEFHVEQLEGRFET
ncbi:hypothetical protein C5167_009459 [Papaver somniferum]|uniref:Uncharacterized protein n=1 Tax=Papaver somniferum TaxID=3469 RepID=A0A4Y7JYV9_PAPSO|nr:hypothetical protein C5167_009459 [Papaver somniferum]